MKAKTFPSYDMLQNEVPRIEIHFIVMNVPLLKTTFKQYHVLRTSE